MPKHQILFLDRGRSGYMLLIAEDSPVHELQQAVCPLAQVLARSPENGQKRLYCDCFCFLQSLALQQNAQDLYGYVSHRIAGA